MNNPIKAVIFDFGGVFTDSPFTAVDEFGVTLGAAPGQIAEIVFGSYENDGDHPWHRLERGEITLEDTRQAVLALGKAQGFNVDIYEMFMKMAASKAGASERQVLVDRVLELKKAGYQLAIITNNVREFADGWRSLLPFVVEEVFDVVVDSSAVGMRKPNPAIFLHTLKLLDNVDASAAVFLDDFHANVAAAGALGMKTVLVGPDPAQAIRDLDVLLT
jgi:epoxide hydrolase-like predicted phosphatase